jgi:hypothetical protein
MEAGAGRGFAPGGGGDAVFAGTVGPARKLSRQQLIAWVKQKRAQGEVVQAVYECCGFGRSDCSNRKLVTLPRDNTMREAAPCGSTN